MAVVGFERIEHPKLLIGEGHDEVRFFNRLLQHLGISDVQVAQYGGKDKLKKFLLTLPRIPGFAQLRKLAVTRDADDNPAGASQSIESALQAANLGQEVVIDTLVLPAADQRGALESIAIHSFEALPIGQCIEQFMNCARDAGHTRDWTVGDAAKARAQSWLAVQSRPGLRLGEAAEAGYVDWNVQAFDGLKTFLLAL